MAEECSEFILDVINLIETKLLRMAPKKRASADEIEIQFRSFLDKSESDPDYYTKKHKGRKRAMTEISRLAIKLDLSPERKQEIWLEEPSRPSYTGPWESPDANGRVVVAADNLAKTDNLANSNLEHKNKRTGRLKASLRRIWESLRRL